MTSDDGGFMKTLTLPALPVPAMDPENIKRSFKAAIATMMMPLVALPGVDAQELTFFASFSTEAEAVIDRMSGAFNEHGKEIHALQLRLMEDVRAVIARHAQEPETSAVIM
jgi:hypothetical protein